MKILHLFPDLMNLYGDYGNITILVRHLKDLGIPVIDPVMCEGLITLFTLLRKDFENESDHPMNNL